MYYIKIEESFDAAHFLSGYKGKCSNLHGHRWNVLVQVKGEDLNSDSNERGMLMDFSVLKNKLKEICDSFDHKFIYEKNTLKEETIKCLKDEGFELIELPFRPTAENLSMYFFEKLNLEKVDIDRVEVYETPNNCAIYENESGR